MKMYWTHLTLFLTLQSALAIQRRYNHGVDLPTTRPLNIAHRGSSGTHPEHTIEGYKQAIADGADVIECDVLVTKDLKLICLHDPYLSTVTDVEEHSEFADRKKSLMVPDYGEHNDWFCFDFTLNELKTLKVKQRQSFRDQKYNRMYNIATLAEFIQVAKEADRPVGIYPEIKITQLLNSLDIMDGLRFEDIFLEALTSHGYTKSTDPCFIQSFSDESLRYLKPKTDLRLVILVWKDVHILGPHLNDSKIQEWGQLYYGLGAWKVQIVDSYDDDKGYKTWISGQLGLLDEVKAAGLKLHLYTYRNEDQYLAWDFKQDPMNEYLYSFKLDIDGYFTDFPETLKRSMDLEYGFGEGSGIICASGATSLMADLLGLYLFTVILSLSFGSEYFVESYM